MQRLAQTWLRKEEKLSMEQGARSRVLNSRPRAGKDKVTGLGRLATTPSEVKYHLGAGLIPEHQA